MRYLFTMKYILSSFRVLATFTIVLSGQFLLHWISTVERFLYLSAMLFMATNKTSRKGTVPYKTPNI